MTQAQIECLMAVAECGSFSKAAKKLYISQPAVSKQISLAESELGFPLFDRTRKAIRLTEAGKLFYNLYANFQKEYDATLRKAKSLGNSKEGSVTIGTSGSWDLAPLYEIVDQAFASRYPSIDLKWEGFSFDDMVASLRNESVDVIFALGSIMSSVSKKDCPNLTCSKIRSIHSVLIYSKYHPLARKSDLSLGDFRDETFFIPSSSAESALRAMTIDQCRPYGFIPSIESVSNFSTILLKIQTGSGVLLTDDWMIFRDSPQFDHLEFDYENDIDICWLDNGKNPTKNLFISELLFSIGYHRIQ